MKRCVYTDTKRCNKKCKHYCCLYHIEYLMGKYSSINNPPSVNPTMLIGISLCAYDTKFKEIGVSIDMVKLRRARMRHLISKDKS